MKNAEQIIQITGIAGEHNHMIGQYSVLYALTNKGRVFHRVKEGDKRVWQLIDPPVLQETTK